MSTAGYTGAISISTDDSTYNAINGIKSIDAPFSADELDTTAIGGSQWRNSIQGLKSMDISMDGDYLASDTAQTAIRSAFTSGATIYLKWLIDGTNGFKIACKCFEYTPGGAVEDLASVSFSLKSQAAPTFLP